MNLGAPDNLEYKIVFGINIILNEDGQALKAMPLGRSISRAADTDRAVFSSAESGSEPSSGESSATDGEMMLHPATFHLAVRKAARLLPKQARPSDGGDGSAEG